MPSELIIQYEHRIHECSFEGMEQILHNYSIEDWRLAAAFTRPLGTITLIFEKPIARKVKKYIDTNFRGPKSKESLNAK